MTKAPNPSADRSWKQIAKRTVLVATTTLALTCLTIGVVSRYRLIVFEPLDPYTQWCVFAVRDGYAMGSYIDSGGPPFWIMYSPDLRDTTEGFFTAAYVSSCELERARQQYATAPSKEGKKQIDKLSAGAKAMAQIARRFTHDVKEKYWLNGNLMLEPFQFMFHIHLAIPFVLLAWYPLYRLARFIQHRCRLTRVGKCVQCGYDLTGNVSGVCSECGYGISKRQGT